MIGQHTLLHGQQRGCRCTAYHDGERQATEPPVDGRVEVVIYKPSDPCTDLSAAHNRELIVQHEASVSI